MYNQYMYGSFAPVTQASQPSERNAPPQQKKNTKATQNDILGNLSGSLSNLLGGLGKQNLFSRFDTGDILLVLIVLFLFLEGDNLELVITLGLLLLFGLDDAHSAL